MKRIKGIISICLAIAIIIGIIGVVSPAPSAKAAKNSYWVTGGSGNSSLKYVGKKFKFSGKWGQGSSLSKSASKYYSGAKTFKKSLKKGKLKTGTLAEEMIYDKKPSVKKNTELVGITLHVQVKNNKVVKLISSAM